MAPRRISEPLTFAKMIQNTRLFHKNQLDKHRKRKALIFARKTYTGITEKIALLREKIEAMQQAPTGNATKNADNDADPDFLKMQHNLSVITSNVRYCNAKRDIEDANFFINMHNEACQMLDTLEANTALQDKIINDCSAKGAGLEILSWADICKYIGENKTC